MPWPPFTSAAAAPTILLLMVPTVLVATVMNEVAGVKLRYSTFSALDAASDDVAPYTPLVVPPKKASAPLLMVSIPDPLSVTPGPRINELIVLAWFSV